jgi:hypothetical protein
MGLKIFSYYKIDEDVMRELAGKKLNPRVRNNLDDISEKLHIPLKRCRRQVQLRFVSSMFHCLLFSVQ